MLNIGIIGCGKIAQVRHIPEYAANENARLVGFFNPSTHRAEEMAAKYGGKVYVTAEDLFADPEIDAVSVCAANYAHAELTIQALRAGKHVLCEKPMAITLEDCERMDAFLHADFRQHGKHAIGKLLSFTTAFRHGGPETWSISPGKGTWFFDKSKAAMGAMADLGIHKTDLLRFLLDQDVVRTTARLATLDKRGPDDELIGVDDNAICVYEMSGGAFGTMTASWTYYGAEDNSTVLYGTKGIMRIYDDPDHSIVVIASDGTKTCYDVEQIQTNDNQTASGVIDEFVAAVEEGRPSILDAEDVLKSMEAVFASMLSAEQGRTVEVDELFGQ